jgi:hypothetical protein
MVWTAVWIGRIKGRGLGEGMGENGDGQESQSLGGDFRDRSWRVMGIF